MTEENFWLMNIIKKLFFAICFQSLGAPYLLAQQFCMHPILEEKAEFYLINVPAATCIEEIELFNYIKKKVGREQASIDCEKKTNGLTKQKVEELLIKKETPSIICNVIKGTFSQCNTVWGGDIAYVDHAKRSGSPWAEITAMVDKKNRTVRFTDNHQLSQGNQYPFFEYYPPMPKKFSKDPYRYRDRSFSGVWRGACGDIGVPINELVPYKTDYKHKNVFYIDGVKGYYGLKKVQKIKFGPKIPNNTSTADF